MGSIFGLGLCLICQTLILAFGLTASLPCSYQISIECRHTDELLNCRPCSTRQSRSMSSRRPSQFGVREGEFRRAASRLLLPKSGTNFFDHTRLAFLHCCGSRRNANTELGRCPSRRVLNCNVAINISPAHPDNRFCPLARHLHRY